MGSCGACGGSVARRPDGSFTCPRCDPAGEASLHMPLRNSSEPLQPVRFLRTAGLYNSADVAGFPAWQAAQLIAAGIAEPYTRPPEPAA